MRTTKSKTSATVKVQRPSSAAQDSLDQLMLEDAGKGISERLDDYAWWLGDDSLSPWLGAMAVLDRALARGKAKTDDIQPLVGLLRSKSAITTVEQSYLGDFLKRHGFRVPTRLSPTVLGHLATRLSTHEFKRPAHRPVTPAYERTATIARWELAVQRVRELEKHGPGPIPKPMKFDAAVERYLVERGSKRVASNKAFVADFVAKLEDYIAGKKLRRSE